jgi:hypothetical protein
MEIMGCGVVEAIIKIAQENVFPHAERMAYFKRHGWFHLQTHKNCGHHEGANNGMKHGSKLVMPQNRLDCAVQTVQLNAMLKAGNNKSININSKKLWSESPTS